ncbi:MAG TPA: excinuclease ABC subunit A [Leucothrix mucor]|nr:excinuclease ABC subunit A [Leucothrix mucor]
MIKSFANDAAESLFDGQCPAFLQTTRRIAERKLLQLHEATSLESLRCPPGNRLELLKGDREGQYSIRINRQYRVCFSWIESDAHHVEIIDYH